MVAALDPLRELDLLRCCEKRDATDVLQEELQRVGGDLRRRLGLRLGLLLCRRNDFDLRLVERGVELVELPRLQPELVEGEGDLVRLQPTRLQAALQEPLSLVGRKDVFDDYLSTWTFCVACGGQRTPLSSAVTP